MSSRFFHLLPFALALIFTGLLPFRGAAQCPQLAQSASLVSSGCTSGTTPCDICPGDTIILTASGTGFRPGACIEWYYGPTNDFNPYSNEGTYLGCSMISALPPLPCDTCPLTLGIMVDACGTEANNEFMILWSGTGFLVNEMSVDFASQNNDGAPPNEDIGNGCGWQAPTAAAIADIQADCPNTVVVGAGPGQSVPPGVPVILYTSAAYDGNYDFSNLCAQAPVIYVLQNSCSRTIGAFSNGDENGNRTTNVSLACGCSDNTSYNCNQLSEADGDYVTDAGFPATYGNSGCAFPALPGLPAGTGSALTATPLQAVITPNLCNGGPYFIVGIADTLLPGCAQVFTNYLSFNVLCYTPVLGTTNLCQYNGPYDLNQLEDPTVPNGTWSGPGVSGDNFDPAGLSGDIVLTFTPASTCGMPANTTIHVIAGLEAVLTMPGNNVTCSGSPAGFMVDFIGGTPPFQFTYSLGGVVQPPVIANSSPHNFSVVLTQDTIVELVSVTANGCSGNAMGTEAVTVMPQLSANITGGGQICQGGSGIDLTITFIGSGPYTFTYTEDGVAAPPVTTSNNPYILHVNPSSGTIYRLVSVSNSDCTGNATGQAIVFVFTPSTASLSGDATVCVQADTTIMVDFTGTGPFNLVYAINGLPQDTIATFDDPLFIPVSVSSTTLFTLVSVQSPGCFGNVNGQATITVNNPPDFTNLQINCNPASNTFTVEFDAVNFTGPLTLVSGSGGFTAGHFTSLPINQALDYTFVFRDANNCGNVTVSGVSTCNCMTLAGDMDQDTLWGCPGDSITAVYLGGANLDPNDSLRFILHTLPDIPTGTILDWSDSPGFLLAADLSVDSVYYISAIAGDYAGGDSIDLADICLSVATGTPIRLRQPPAALLPADTMVCAGSNLLLMLNLAGTPPFDLEYTLNGVQQPGVQGIPGNSTFLNLPIGDSALLVVNGLSDQFCSLLVPDTMRIFTFAPPSVSNLLSICDQQSGTYVLEFDANGGLPPYTVTGLAGSFSGNHFTSVVLPSAQGYVFALGDGNNCVPVNFSGISGCACQTDAGTMDSQALKYCPGEPATGLYNNDGQLDANDTLMFVLHTGAGNVIGTVIAISGTPVIPYQAGVTLPGVNYFLSAVAGNALPNGQVDLSDPCLSVAPGTPVRWNVAPTATISGNFDACAGQTQLLSIQFTGQAPFLFTYSTNGQPTTTIAPQNNFSISTTLLQSATISLVSVQDANCPGTVSGQAVITVHPVPQITNLNIICNPDNLSYAVEFDVTNADLATVQVSGNLTGNYNPANGHFIGNSMPLAMPYQAIVQDIWQCGADTVSGTETCACSTLAGQITSTGINVCFGEAISLPQATGYFLDPNDTLYYILYEAPLMLPQSVLAIANQPQFGQVAGLVSGKTYFVSAIAGNQLPGGGIDLNDPCLSVSNAIAVSIRAIPTATLAGDTTVCAGSSYTFPVVLTGSAPYQFSYTVNGGNVQTVVSPQNNFFLTANNVQQTQVFTLVSVSDKYCQGTVGGSVTVGVQAPPMISITGGGTACPGDTIQLSFGLSNADSTAFVLTDGSNSWNLSGVQNGDQFAIVASTTSALFTISNIQVFGNSCPAQVNNNTQVQLAPITLSLQGSDFNGYGVSCPGTTDGQISAVVGGGFMPVNLVWSTGDTGLSTSLLPAGDYQVTATDAAGCTSVASLTLEEPEAIFLDYDILDPSCKAGETGGIRVLAAGGGAGILQLQIGATAPVALTTLPLTLDRIDSGTYNLSVVDANGCSVSESIEILPPGGIFVELGADTTIFRSDSVLLSPVITGGPAVQFSWTPQEGLQDPLSLSTIAKPTRSIQYQLTVQDSNGCTATDVIRIMISTDSRVFLPNVINTNQDGVNGVWMVYTGPEVRIIRFARIYDRWGALVFDAQDLQPNDPAGGWDGRWRNKDVQPGVYTCVVEVEYTDGETEVFGGDVTVVR